MLKNKKLHHNGRYAELFKELAVTGLISFFSLVGKSQAIKGSDAEISAKVINLLEKHRDAFDACLESALQSGQTASLSAETDMENLWQKMSRHIDNVQSEIKTAKKRGYRNSTVKKIFDRVYPDGNISGQSNYCVAGAMYVHRLCNDPVLNEILPNGSISASEYGGHPTVSCNALLKYFKKNLGSRFAQKGDADFSRVLNNLKPGDIIIISSRRNTSSGKHCMTVSGRVKNGKIAARGFNKESNENIELSKILGAANIMDEYCYRRARAYAMLNEPVQQTSLPGKSYQAKATPVKEKAVSDSQTKTKAASSPQKQWVDENGEPLPMFLQRGRDY